MENTKKYLTVNGKKVLIENERNLLELIRKANIDIPTFCYHSELSVYGACRLCLVEIEGRGIQASCSMKPEAGMKIKTHTEEIREIRKISLELLLASHEHNCAVCERSDCCKLREIAAQLGIEKVRFTAPKNVMPVDKSSHALVRDPNKCVLCGDCVRYCDEIQNVGAIGIAHRGSNSCVVPAFGKDLADGECVNCGQCASVCPTGAIVPKSEIDVVFKEIENPKKVVVAQIAPAVRVALGDMFGLEANETNIGQIVAALKLLGFNHVYDTSFTADMTIIEETTEFLKRKQKGENLPIFTSCCPAWVKYAEQYLPEMLPHLSSCKSPQQMFGSIAKEQLAKEMNLKREDIVVVSIMPCTAKKFEAKRPEFAVNENPDVDHVITTRELGRMIKEAGIMFKNLKPESMDLPFGFYTGAGVIFGNTGGVSEAVLRYAYEKVTGEKLENVDFEDVRGNEGVKEAQVDIKGTPLKIAIVHGLRNAQSIARKVLNKEVDYDIVEVMSCPGGCVAGAGQPAPRSQKVIDDRQEAIYTVDKLLPIHKSQDNVLLQETYKNFIGEPNGHKAHELLHTHYHSRKKN